MADSIATCTAPEGAPTPEQQPDPKLPCCCGLIVKCVSAIVVLGASLGGVCFAIVRVARPVLFIERTLTTPSPLPTGPDDISTTAAAAKLGCRDFMGEPLNDPMYCTRGSFSYDETCCCKDKWNLPRYVCTGLMSRFDHPTCCRGSGSATTIPIITFLPEDDDPGCMGNPFRGEAGEPECWYIAAENRTCVPKYSYSGSFLGCIDGGTTTTAPSPSEGPMAGSSTSPLPLDSGLITSSGGARQLRGFKDP